MSEGETAGESLGVLVADTARLWRVRLDRRLQSLGLSQAKWRVMVALARSDEPLLQRELAEIIGVEAPTVATLLERMECDGWILRRVSVADRRAKIPELTEKAEEVVAQVVVQARQLEREICEQVSPQELQACCEVLAKLKQRLQLM